MREDEARDLVNFEAIFEQLRKPKKSARVSHKILVLAAQCDGSNQVNYNAVILGAFRKGILKPWEVS